MSPFSKDRGALKVKQTGPGEQRVTWWEMRTVDLRTTDGLKSTSTPKSQALRCSLQEF